jgi:hypothetical protein
MNREKMPPHPGPSGLQGRNPKAEGRKKSEGRRPKAVARPREAEFGLWVGRVCPSAPSIRTCYDSAARWDRRALPLFLKPLNPIAATNILHPTYEH